jgi:polyhydroxyalkanoate synthesis regulator phasin
MPKNKYTVKELRSQVHDLLDWTWKEGYFSRGQAYQIFQELMGWRDWNTHISHLNKKQLREAKRVLSSASINKFISRKIIK